MEATGDGVLGDNIYHGGGGQRGASVEAGDDPDVGNEGRTRAEYSRFGGLRQFGADLGWTGLSNPTWRTDPDVSYPPQMYKADLRYPIEWQKSDRSFRPDREGLRGMVVDAPRKCFPTEVRGTIASVRHARAPPSQRAVPSLPSRRAAHAGAGCLVRAVPGGRSNRRAQALYRFAPLRHIKQPPGARARLVAGAHHRPAHPEQRARRVPAGPRP